MNLMLPTPPITETVTQEGIPSGDAKKIVFAEETFEKKRVLARVMVNQKQIFWCSSENSKDVAKLQSDYARNSYELKWFFQPK